MSENLNTALTLMGIGMLTVFLVLILVVVVGKALIWFVNSYVPEVANELSIKTGTIDPNKLAAITSAVEIVTKGRGYIKQIEKID